MKIDLNEKDGLVRQLVVEIEAEKVQAEINQKLTDFRKRADIKGFRKGKVPMNMIKSLYGDEVKAMVADELVKATLSEAVREKDLRVAATPTLTALDYTDDGGLGYTAELEVFPELGPVGFEGLEISEDAIKVEDKEVDDIAEFYRSRFADVNEVDREARGDDLLVIDLNKVNDPAGLMEQEAFEGVEVDLSREMTVKEFKEQLPGMKAGEEKEITVVYPDDYPEEKFAGNSIKYNAVVKQVKERVLPPFDDALAKRSGQAETALELKLKIRKELETEKADAEKNKVRGSLIAQLCEKNNILVPDGLVDEYLTSMVADYKKQVPDADEKEIREQYRDNAANSIRWNLLYHRLAEQEKIEVLAADTDVWINRFAEANNVSPEQASQALAQSGRSGNMREAILEQKVLDFLAEKATRK